LAIQHALHLRLHGVNPAEIAAILRQQDNRVV
jgi:hypothetical protein